MPSHYDIESRVERALIAAKERIPGFNYSMEEKSSEYSQDFNENEAETVGFVAIYEIPAESKDDEISQLGNRFHDESMAVGDIFEKYGLPRPNDHAWSNEVVDSDSQYFYSEFKLDDDRAYSDLASRDFGLDPDSNALDQVVMNRVAGDDTPPMGNHEERDHVPSVDTEDLMDFASHRSGMDSSRLDNLMMKAAGDQGGRMDSVRNAVDDFKEHQADERETERQERATQRGAVNDTGGLMTNSPSYQARRGRGGRDMKT